MADESRFWDKLADKYARQPIADEAAYQRKLEITRGYLSQQSRVLEVGCGTGSTAILHAPLVAEIEGVDFSERMLDIARGKAEAAGLKNLTFSQGDILRLDRPVGSYDVVMAMSVLHLLKDADAMIGRVHDLLKSGGVFISSTACLGDTMGAIKYVAPLGKALGLLPELNVMTQAHLIESMRRAGFVIEHDWLPAKGKAVFVVARKAA